MLRRWHPACTSGRSRDECRAASAGRRQALRGEDTYTEGMCHSRLARRRALPPLLALARSDEMILRQVAARWLGLTKPRRGRAHRGLSGPAGRRSPSPTPRGRTRVKNTDRNRFGLLPVKPVRAGCGSGRFQTGLNSNFKFKFQKIKNSQKIPKNTSSCDESNGVNFFQIFVHLVYFASI